MRRTDRASAYRLAVSSLARQEARAAIAWYRRVNPHAAVALNAALKAAFELLAEAPLRWAEHRPGLRRYLLPRHPYTVFYRVVADRIEVMGVVHQHRNPDAWRPGP